MMVNQDTVANNTNKYQKVPIGMDETVQSRVKVVAISPFWASQKKQQNWKLTMGRVPTFSCRLSAIQSCTHLYHPWALVHEHPKTKNDKRMCQDLTHNYCTLLYPSVTSCYIKFWPFLAQADPYPTRETGSWLCVHPAEGVWRYCCDLTCQASKKQGLRSFDSVFVDLAISEIGWLFMTSGVWILCPVNKFWQHQNDGCNAFCHNETSCYFCFFCSHLGTVKKFLVTNCFQRRLVRLKGRVCSRVSVGSGHVHRHHGWREVDLQGLWAGGRRAARMASLWWGLSSAVMSEPNFSVWSVCRCKSWKIIETSEIIWHPYHYFDIFWQDFDGICDVSKLALIPCVPWIGTSTMDASMDCHRQMLMGFWRRLEHVQKSKDWYSGMFWKNDCSKKYIIAFLY